MSKRPVMPRPGVRESVEELRASLGLFSFQASLQAQETVRRGGLLSQFGTRPGGIVEWMVDRDGAGSRNSGTAGQCGILDGDGIWAVIDPARECYLPAFSGWGIDFRKVMVLHPGTLDETSWSVEQCLHVLGFQQQWPGSTSERIPARVHRRWQLAAEAGGGMGVFFVPIQSRRQPNWADLRLLVTPLAGGKEDARRIQIEVLYCRGRREAGVCQASGNRPFRGEVRQPLTAAIPALPRLQPMRSWRMTAGALSELTRAAYRAAVLRRRVSGPSQVMNNPVARSQDDEGSGTTLSVPYWGENERRLALTSRICVVTPIPSIVAATRPRGVPLATQYVTCSRPNVSPRSGS